MPRPRCEWSYWMTVLSVLVGLLLLFQACRAQELDDQTAEDVVESSVVDRISFQSLASDDKVKLDVYYETNCPDSMDFVTKQLWPTFEKMSSIMKINLFPFGKAIEHVRRDGSVAFYCHHGPSECFGNTVQACAIKLYPDTETHLSYINCMEAYFTPSRAVSKCARRNSLDYSRIIDCANGPDGNKYLSEMAAATRSLDPPLNFVPWIVVNDVFSEAAQRQALNDLSSVVCKFYKGTKPSACSS